MSDLTKCAGTGCHDKKRCRRFTAPASPYQSWAEFWKNHANCQHYLSNGAIETMTKLIEGHLAILINDKI